MFALNEGVSFDLKRVRYCFALCTVFLSSCYEGFVIVKNQVTKYCKKEALESKNSGNIDI